MDLRKVALSLVTASLVSCGVRDSDRKSPPPTDVTQPNSREPGQSGSSPSGSPDTQAPVENVVGISEADSGKQYIAVLEEDSQLSEVHVIGLPKNLVMALDEGPDRIKIGLKKKGKDGQDIPATDNDFIGYHSSSGRIEVDLKADQEKVLFFNFFIKKAGSANFSDGIIQFCVIRSKPENIEINTRAHALISSGYTDKSTAEAIYNLAHEKDAAWFELFKAAYLHRMNHRAILWSGRALEFAETVANKTNGAEWFGLYEAAFRIFDSHEGIKDHEAAQLASLAADRNFNVQSLLEHYTYFKNLTRYVTVDEALAFAEKILSSENVAETSSLTKEAMSFYVDNNLGTLATAKIIEFANLFTEGGNDRKKFEFYKEAYAYFVSIMPSEAEKKLYAAGLTDMSLSSTEPSKWVDVFKETFNSLQQTTPKWRDRVNAAVMAADQAYPRIKS